MSTSWNILDPSYFPLWDLVPYQYNELTKLDNFWSIVWLCPEVFYSFLELHQFFSYPLKWEFEPFCEINKELYYSYHVLILLVGFEDINSELIGKSLELHEDYNLGG